MKSYSFYFNASDWLASPAVKLMSKAERGVYINLLALAWGMERPGTLPASADKLRRLAEMSADEWAESGEILLEKFPLSDCGTFRYNPRLVAEAEKEQLRSEKNAEAGRKSAEKRAAEKAAAEAALQRNANANPTGVEINPTSVEEMANENPTISKGKLSKEGKPMSDSATPSPDGLDFDSFWNAYGRKEGSKGKMARQWDGLKLATRHTILNGLAAYKQAKTVNGPQFLPMPQTFLNGRLWEAETYGAAPLIGQYHPPATTDPETDRLRAFTELQAQQPAPVFVYKSSPNQPMSQAQEPASLYHTTA